VKIVRILLPALVGALPLSAVRAQASPFADCRPMPSDTALRASLRSVFIPMPDGTRLAADVFLPNGLATGRKLPTVLTATRYWRAPDQSQANPQVLDWIRRGYAAVVVDVRGTGASFGTWKYPWSRGEVRDLGDVVRWISTQPWSDGNVGAIGTSYTANTAQLAAATVGTPAQGGHSEVHGFRCLGRPHRTRWRDQLVPPARMGQGGRGNGPEHAVGESAPRRASDRR
jgi:hypothetical protein